ncbi:DNA-binding response regulator, OmpR family, contains REC and winged-helix (wHTH) domain [Eubacterium ruminantium]|uniref:Stage 0 sporulation protein A homolog n=1 Tax=Eubacterium ruminantium TaxID=42322 RepID=A0A1T4L7P0_9FIRM|nr:response regulator transcription factor [Eubacterium ruminantium]SCW43816.1 DNA-binding response regulator, OmpR family, contains REC and winged-helix (wHTH) domain [Eubacterium ruminantium]SDM78896.1 DNA-binding response regulator, OmpR family, contains REC and winged-helix (wHTH) domain [Eubacterium ruminantium]SJZ50531.1 DNA-binding response regulator, OmpR family, contains REC and winged-helix (wHTH) domain [Eubacterium ruminantium]
MTDILIIEDNEELGKLVYDFLKREGYTVEWRQNAEEGLTFMKNEICKLLLLDVMLPGIDGYAALQEIRRTGKLPVLMMSARTDDQSKILGLQVGADDYIEKPFSIQVLGLKIKALMRRSYDMTEGRQLLTYGNITVDLATRTVYKDDNKIDITGKEYDLLEYMMHNPNQIIRKEKLFDEVWGKDCFSEVGSLNVHIRWLREKLEDDPKNPKLIQTIWRVGYKFGGAEV